MIERFTIQVGELRLAKYDLGNKAGLLDVLALKDLGSKGPFLKRFRLLTVPVPLSCVILDEFFHHAVSTGLATVDGDQVVVPDPRAFMDAIELPPISGAVAIRSAFTAEDKSDLSYTGMFETVLNVPIESFGVSPARVKEPSALAGAIARVWTSGLRGKAGGRLDILVMKMIAPTFSGVAFSELDYEDDLVNFTSGLADEMLAGRAEASTLELPKLGPFDPPSKTHINLPFARRLQELLRSVRLALGKGNWDVEWADDGETTWVIQVRPITAPTVRNEVFTYLPLKEALPDLPSRFMSTLIESAGDDVFSLYREVDPTLPTTRKYIEVLYGRPMVNLSLMMDVMRHWGEPTARVTWNIGRAPSEARAHRPRQLRHAGKHVAFRIRATRAIRRSGHAARELHALSEHPGDTLSEVIETARKVYAVLTRHMLLLRFAMGEKYRGMGHTLGTQMYTDLSPLRNLARARPELASALEKGAIPRDTEFRLLWEGWLRKHGHRGVYELDLARPRFRETQQEVLQMIAHPPAQAPARGRSLVAKLLPRSLPSHAAHRREELRYEAMVAFSRIRQRLLDLALPMGVTAEMLFSLSVEEACRLDSGWRPSSDFLRDRGEETQCFAGLRIPETVRRNDSLEDGGASRAMHGVGLARGEANGKALILRDPVTRLPDGYSPHETILVVPSVDAGWVPTFGLVSGVVVESGGNLSHGSIILRELAIPSVTNVRGATHDIRPGQRIHVSGSEGRVDLHSS